MGVEGCILSFENPTGKCASCEATAVGDTFIQSIDAIATASAPPSNPPLHAASALYAIEYSISLKHD